MVLFELISLQYDHNLIGHGYILVPLVDSFDADVKTNANIVQS